jgi:hypothetical protein
MAVSVLLYLFGLVCGGGALILAAFLVTSRRRRLDALKRSPSVAETRSVRRPLTPGDLNAIRLAQAKRDRRAMRNRALAKRDAA